MTKIKVKFTAVLIIVTLLLTPFVSFAVDPNIENECAKSIVNLKIMQGYEDGSLRLQNKIKRSEFTTLVVKMMGYDKDTDLNSVNLSFKDLKKSHWAYNYASLAVKYKLIVGTPDNKFNPDNYITYAEALTVLVRALGYEDTLKGSWPNNVISKSTELGLDKNLDLQQGKQITRGEMSVMVYNSLTVEFK